MCFHGIFSQELECMYCIDIIIKISTFEKNLQVPVNQIIHFKVLVVVPEWIEKCFRNLSHQVFLFYFGFISATLSNISFFYLTKEEIIPWSIPDSWWTLRWWRWVCTRLDRILMVTEKSWKSTWCVFGKGSVGSKIDTWNWGEGGVVAGERLFSGFKLFRLRGHPYIT